MGIVGILPVGRIASYVELYVVADDSHADRVLQTGVTQAQIDLEQLTDESLNLEHGDFFLFIESDGIATGRA